jgi:hypothetical protein
LGIAGWCSVLAVQLTTPSFFAYLPTFLFTHLLELGRDGSEEHGTLTLTLTLPLTCSSSAETAAKSTEP